MDVKYQVEMRVAEQSERFVMSTLHTYTSSCGREALQGQQSPSV